jgi:hypothetical protein
LVFAEVEVSLQGSLDAFALPDVLVLLASTGKSGEFHVTGQRNTPARTYNVSGTFWLEQGHFVGFDVAHAGDPASAMFELLRLDDGIFDFEPGVPGEPLSPVEVEPVLAEAERFLSEWREIEAVVPSVFCRVTLSVEPPSSKFVVTGDQWRLVALIGGGCRVDDIVAHLGKGELVGCRAVKELAELGLITINTSSIEPVSTPAYTTGPSGGAWAGVSAGVSGAVAVDAPIATPPIDTVPIDTVPIDTVPIDTGVAASAYTTSEREAEPVLEPVGRMSSLASDAVSAAPDGEAPGSADEERFAADMPPAAEPDLPDFREPPAPEVVLPPILPEDGPEPVAAFDDLSVGANGAAGGRGGRFDTQPLEPVSFELDPIGRGRGREQPAEDYAVAAFDSSSPVGDPAGDPYADAPKVFDYSADAGPVGVPVAAADDPFADPFAEPIFDPSGSSLSRDYSASEGDGYSGSTTGGSGDPSLDSISDFDSLVTLPGGGSPATPEPEPVAPRTPTRRTLSTALSQAAEVASAREAVVADQAALDEARSEALPYLPSGRREAPAKPRRDSDPARPAEEEEAPPPGTPPNNEGEPLNRGLLLKFLSSVRN